MIPMKYSKSFCALAVLCLTFLAGQLRGQEEGSQEGIKFERVRDGIVRVGWNRGSTANRYTWTGTGFAVDSSCTFVTAQHLLRGIKPDRLVIRFQVPKLRRKVKTFSARIVYKHKTKDLAFLTVDTLKHTNIFRDKPCDSKSLHIFNIYKDAPAVGTTGKEVFIIGHPRLSNDPKESVDIPIVRLGLIASTEILWNKEPMILLDLQGVPGFSGSPVILKDTGEVVGVVYGPGPTKRVFGFEWATPISPEDYRAAVNASSDQK